MSNQRILNQRNLRRKIDLLRSLSVTLTPSFGRQTSNPLLKGQNVSEIVQFCINSYVVVAFDMWRSMVNRMTDNLGMRQAKVTFRASLIHLLDVVSEAQEDEDNLKEDAAVAGKMIIVLKEILSMVDELDYKCEFIGEETRHGQRVTE